MKNRKLTVPKPLQNLSTEQLAQVHAWFSRFTYREMAGRILDAFNVVISVNQLTRYYARFSKAQLFNTVLYTPLTPADMAAIENADPIPDEINLRQIKEQCLRLVKREDIDAYDLKYLHDVVTYEQRRDLKERRGDLDEKWIALRRQQAQFREHLRQSKVKPESK